jgi:cytochrome c
MKRSLGFIVAISSLLAVSAADSAFAQDENISAGRELMSRHCSNCHAIGTDDVSPLPQAPAFRTLGKRYPIESLEESFAEGIFTGHADMPELRFRPRDIGAAIAYLKSIQQE